MSTQERTVTLQGKPLELTPREFELLVFLLRHPHRVFTREELLEQLWEYPCPVDTRTVDTHIQRLRKKLSRCGGHRDGLWSGGINMSRKSKHGHKRKSPGIQLRLTAGCSSCLPRR